MTNQKLIITTFSLFIFSLIFTVKTRAQKIDTRIGGMLAYGSEIENLGIGANAEFGVIDKLSISPSFIFYLPKENGPAKTTWFELNANANYYFLQDAKFDVYGLAGLDYTHVSVKYDGNKNLGPYSDKAKYTDGRVGLNIGAGANLHLSNENIIPFAELKYVIIDDGQLVIAAGVKFKI